MDSVVPGSDAYTVYTVLSVIAVLIHLLFAVFMVKIFAKAGNPKRWGIVFVVPVANIIFLWIFAFTTWPIHKQVQL